MGFPVIDITGMKFNRLTVIGRANKKNKYNKFLFLCRCECGTEKYLEGYAVRNGYIKSCGCLHLQLCYLGRYKKHGMIGTDTYKTWQNIKKRCLCKTDAGYSDYGGRGITICDEWRKDFLNFYEYVGDRPQGLTLDRIDNNGNYEPGNVRWATTSQQNKNRRPFKRRKKYERDKNKSN